jgi:mannan polymerase II complex MNN11 subunit
MHFALPPRKTSQAPYAPATRNVSHMRQQQVRLAGYFIGGLLTFYIFLRYVPLSSPLATSVSSGTPPVVIVTVFDEQQMSEEYISKIKANREDYALRQGLHTSSERVA